MSAGRFRTAIFVLMGLFMAAHVQGASPEKYVREGNRHYAGGEYTQAIEAYDAALLEKQEAFEPKFNKANSYYRLEDLDKAVDLYREVAAESKDMGLVAKAKYNLGNCFFEKGVKEKDSDLEKALKNFEDSITQWRGVLDIEPENEKAARNIEVARLTIKDIIDQINKQKQQQKEQQKRMEELKKKLEELLEKQKGLSQQNQSVQDRHADGNLDAAQAEKEYQQLSDEQGGLQGETEQVVQELGAQQAAGEPGPMEPIRQELEKAVSEQSEAVDELSRQEGQTAKGSQDKAAEHIENALKNMTQQQQDQSQQQQQQQEQQQEQQEQQENQQQDQQEQQEQQEQQPQEQMQAADATAEEILEKEKQDRERRQKIRAGQKKVDKDW